MTKDERLVSQMEGNTNFTTDPCHCSMLSHQYKYTHTHTTHWHTSHAHHLHPPEYWIVKGVGCLTPENM